MNSGGEHWPEGAVDASDGLIMISGILGLQKTSSVPASQPHKAGHDPCRMQEGLLFS